MIDHSVPKVQLPSTRESRGIALFNEHQDEIRFEGGVWLVPSQREATSLYEVTIGRRGDVCECRDFEFRGLPCVHIIAATICRAKTAPCSGCCGRFRHEVLEEVTEDHDSLTWFVGDRICGGCLNSHGGIA